MKFLRREVGAALESSCTRGADYEFASSNKLPSWARKYRTHLADMFVTDAACKVGWAGRSCQID